MIRIALHFAPSRLCVRLFLVCCLLLASHDVAANDATKPAALVSAVKYLWSQQADDGGWHSPQYAVMRSGQSLTPFVLHTLLKVPESTCPRPKGGVERALDFIRSHVGEDGSIGHADPDIAEYPVYSTAYALRCLAAIKGNPSYWKDSDEKLMSDMYVFLSTAQFDETHGFATTHAAYGGWGFDAARENGNPGHMDLAHTRRALQALRDAISEKSFPQFTRAELFLRVVQRDRGALAKPPRIQKYLFDWSNIPFDGGFFFSPIVDAANKGRFQAEVGGKAAPHFRSYSTATCDGILSLLAAGVPPEDRRVVTAIEWLKAHEDFDYPQGVPADDPEPWGAAIRFYHYAARAETYTVLDWPGDWRAKLSDVVGKEQAADGSFRNTASPLVKEDDPILCTALAAIALTNCQLNPRKSGVDGVEP